MFKLSLVAGSVFCLFEYLFASISRADVMNVSFMRHDSSLSAQANPRINGVVERAHELIGTPYRWGGQTVKDGFDCSGLLVYLFRTEAGIKLPRTTTTMLASNAKTVARNQLKVGDAVFFKHNGAAQLKHVGIYIGNDRFIHSPRTGKTIRIDSLSNTYWNKSYLTAKRFH
ncbi:murein DD-endopeptidase [Pseudomonas sp. TE24901]